MNQNTSGAVLLLILAAAGFVNHEPAVWAFAAMAAALAFLAEDLSGYPFFFAALVRGVLALLSWAAVGAAALVLAI